MCRIIEETHRMVVAFLEKTRKEKKVKQKDFCKALGISVRQWQRIVKGDSRIGIETVESACDVLGFKLLIVDKSFL